MPPAFASCASQVHLPFSHHRHRAPTPPLQVRGKTSLMTQYCTKYKTADEVPDPYYGGAAGFEKVLDLLEDASQGLLGHIQQEQQQKQAGGS